MIWLLWWIKEWFCSSRWKNKQKNQIWRIEFIRWSTHCRVVLHICRTVCRRLYRRSVDWYQWALQTIDCYSNIHLMNHVRALVSACVNRLLPHSRHKFNAAAILCFPYVEYCVPAKINNRISTWYTEKETKNNSTNRLLLLLLFIKRTPKAQCVATVFTLVVEYLASVCGILSRRQISVCWVRAGAHESLFSVVRSVIYSH